MNFGTLTAPSVDPATGSYTNSVTVSMSALAGAAIRYTTNNTAVQSTSPLYTEPLVVDVTTTIRARAYHPDYTSSAETTRTYTLAAGTPVFSPTAGTYAAGQLITVTAPSVGSTIRYTLSGAEPTTSDPVIASGDTLVVGQYTLKARAWKTGADPSAVASATYGVTGSLATGGVAAGGDHTVAVRPDGVVFSWGRNSSGETGHGTTASPQPLPRAVSGVTGVTQAAAGANHSLVRLSGGSSRGWGLNGSGRLGDASTTTRLLPVAVSGLTSASRVVAGSDHSLALLTDGTVRGWGDNATGEVGDGTTTPRSSPVSVSGLSTVVGVAAGRDFSLAVTQAGGVWAWGRNAEYQLGNGSTTNSSTPTPVSGLTTATAVAAGTLHGLALLADGTVVGWGRNVLGAVGDGTTTDRSTPVAVVGLTNIIAIAAGIDYSLALDSSGVVWSWGANGHGQLADGGTATRPSPAAIGGLSDIVSIAAGDAHAFAVTSDGTVYGWGRNHVSQIGTGTTTTRLTPVAISGPNMAWRVATPTLSLAAGQYATEQTVTVSIADPEATLRYTTTGVDPTAGDVTVTSGGTLTITQSQTLKVSGWKTGAPTSVVVAAAYELKAVAPAISPGAGAYASAQSVTLSTTTGSATIRYTLDGAEPTDASPAYSAPIPVADTRTVKARTYRTGWTSSDSTHASYWISAGTVATPTITPAGGTQTAPVPVTLATSTEGATIRYTLDGTAPTGQSPVYQYPFVVSTTTTVQAQGFKAGYTPSAVATETYAVDAAGATGTPAITPAGGRFATAQTVTISGPGGATLRYTTDGTDPTTSAATIASGATVTVGQSQVLKVRAWSGGLEPSAVRRADFLIVGAIAAGDTHSVALEADGTVWAWGANGFGQVGDASWTTRLAPVPVLTGAVAIAAGYTHTLAVKADGTAWAWGAGGFGRLGNGGQSNANAPVQVTGLTGVVAVAAGQWHSLALKADGTVWAFGRNESGELGDGTTTQRTTAVQVTGLGGVVAIAAGYGTSYALQADAATGGILWAWGANQHGQLGDGSTQPRLTPTRVVNLSSVRGLAAGLDGAAAIHADGRVFTWGRGDLGQLGTGGTASAAIPAAVVPLVHARVIAAGAQQAFALDRVTRTFAWGVNADGQLGFGEVSTTPTYVPTRSDLSGVLGIASRAEHTLAMMPDGTVRGVGANGGRLGNGATAASVAPVAVQDLTLAANTWLTTDPDADGLSTWREYFLGTDPLAADTNGNGLHDGAEESAGLDAANPDTDGDGIRNDAERAAGTDPFRADTDGDGHADGVDAFPLDPTRWDPPLPGGGDTTPPVITLKEPVSACPVPCPL
jgi:alpha-tubulin suppressor-like RCC1 family protein